MNISRQGHLRRLSLVWRRQPLYFITTRVEGRRPLLAAPGIHAILREEWMSWDKRYGWSVERYVIMPDHVHFFAMPAPETNKSIELTVGKWKEWTAKRILKRLGMAAPLWQSAFFDHLLRSGESYREKWDYVRENPMRAGLVKDASQWPYGGWIDFQ